MLHERLRAMKFESQGATYKSYIRKLQERKGVVEERIMGEEFVETFVRKSIDVFLHAGLKKAV